MASAIEDIIAHVLPLVLAIQRLLDTGSYQLPSSRQLIKDWGNEAQRYSFRDNDYPRR